MQDICCEKTCTQERADRCAHTACCHKQKHRDDREKQRLLNRLSRLEGQVRGVRAMVEKDIYCIDILTQTAAITAAVGAFNRELLKEHLRTCVVQDLKDGNEETIDELLAVMQKLMK